MSASEPLVVRSHEREDRRLSPVVVCGRPVRVQGCPLCSDHFFLEFRNVSKHGAGGPYALPWTHTAYQRTLYTPHTQNSCFSMPSAAQFYRPRGRRARPREARCHTSPADRVWTKSPYCMLFPQQTSPPTKARPLDFNSLTKDAPLITWLAHDHQRALRHALSLQVEGGPNNRPASELGASA